MFYFFFFFVVSAVFLIVVACLLSPLFVALNVVNKICFISLFRVAAYVSYADALLWPHKETRQKKRR